MKKVSQKSINKLKEKLPRGYTRILAEKLDISKQAVSQSLNRGNLESEVIKEAIKLSAFHQKGIEITKKALVK